MAELRRALLKGAEIQDYEFLDCSLYALPDGRATAPGASLTDGDEPVSKVRLSELFTFSPSPVGRGNKGEGYAPVATPLTPTVSQREREMKRSSAR